MPLKKRHQNRLSGIRCVSIASLEFILPDNISMSVIQFDPENDQSTLSVMKQNAAANSSSNLSQSKKNKGKRKAVEEPLSDDDDDNEAADMDVDLSFGGDDSFSGATHSPRPMPASGGIAELRSKLHAKMASLRRGGGYAPESGAEPSDRDGLLEERRKQRALLREKRRKETKEKIRREQEQSGKKKGPDNKEKKEFKVQGNITKVCFELSLFITASF